MTATRAATAAAILLFAVAACSGSSSAGTGNSASPPPVAAVGARPSPGCQGATTAKVTDVRTLITVGGKTRNYLLTTPAPHTRPEPLVMDFHGYAEGDLTESRTTQFGALGQRVGFLVAFPNGRGTPIAWDTSTKPSNPDLAFVDALVSHLEATQCIDESRIYATGLSQGAFMTSTLACTRSSTFAAFAPVAGVEFPTPCHPMRGVPILAFHGTADPIVHFNGGIGRKVLANDLHLRPRPFPPLPKVQLNGPGYPAHVREWAKRDHCKQTPTDTMLSPHVIHRVYPCPAGVAVDFDIILGGGHSWPGSAFSKEIAAFVGPTTSEIDATTTIWSFFQQFHLSPM